MAKGSNQSVNKIVPYVAVLVVAILIVLCVALFVKEIGPDSSSSENPTESASSESESASETESESETDPPLPTASALDAARIQELIAQYYNAKAQDDADTLNKIVETDVPFNAADLISENQFVTKYDNFNCYVVAGDTEDHFIVYVKYDIFFNGISTGAAALNHFAVIKSGSAYRITAKEVPDAFRDCILATEKMARVEKLKAQVESELAAACEKDQDLKYLIQLLNGE